MARLSLGWGISALLLALAPGVNAQESRASIVGRVMDIHDAAIADASVSITNVDTGVATLLHSNESGSYAAPLLLPGSYRVVAEHAGFKKLTRSGISLSVNDYQTVDLKLEVGELAQSVTISAQTSAVETGDASLSTIVGTKELTELPIAHGNPYALIALASGTTFEGDPTLNRPYEPTHIVNYSMNGSIGGTTDITMDGVSNTSKGSGGGGVAAGYVPPVDAIGEMRVETSSFDARTGQTSGGLVNISIKSGTNRLHGNAQYTKMQPEWFANTFFANKQGLPNGDFAYNRWSGSLNGPVYLPKLYNGHNKTFFMWAYEAIKDGRPRNGSTDITVPTAAMRKGDFSELLALGSNYTIYDPTTRRQQTGSTTRFQQDPFPGNIIPSTKLNPVAMKLLDFYPLPINNGTTVDHRNNYPQPNLTENADYWTHIARVDHNFGSGDRVFIRANTYKRNTSRLDYFKSRASGLREVYDPVGASIDEVHSFSSSFVLNLRYGYTRFTRQTQPFYGRDFDLTSVGFPASLNNVIGPSLREFPVLEISGYFAANRIGEARFMDTHSIVAAFSKLTGSHNLDFGFEARAYRQDNYPGDSSRSGRYVFDTTWTRGPLDNANSSPIGQGFAAFLLGLPSASANSYISRPADYAEQSTVWAGYVQDNWRVRRNLTLTLGLRYELEGPLTERYNRSISDFDVDAALPIEAQVQANYKAGYAANPTPELPPDKLRVRGGLLFAGVNGQSSELWGRDWNNFAPRIGLAYSLAKGTVFRAGYGAYFSAMGLRRTDVLQNGFSVNTLFVPTRDSGLSFSATLSNPYPNGLLSPTGSGAGLMTDLGNTITFFNPEPKAAPSHRWQGSLQRQVGRTTILEAAYVGAKTVKSEIARDLNVIDNANLSRSPFFDQARVNYLTANIANPFRNVPGVNGTLGTNSTITRETLLRPFPQFTAVNTSTYQGYAWYHSLQLRAVRRFSSTTVISSYTWAKSMEGRSYLNPGDTTPYRSLSSQDRKHRIAASVLYDLPVGRHGKLLHNIPKPIDYVIGGWQLSTIYIYQSGVPLAWQDVVFFGNANDIANGPHTVEQWFNINAGFTRNSATRPASHYRSWPLRFSDLREPALSNVDASASKHWRLGERGRDIQVRAEALNAFNHTWFASPQMDQFNSGFGQITTQRNYARQIQAVLRLTF